MRTRPSCVLASILITTMAGTGCLDGAEPEDELGVEIDELANGTAVPTGQLEAVGTLVSLGGCTATLITDTLVLTAAHCICNDVNLTTCSTTATFTLKNVRPVDNPNTPGNESLVRQDIPLAGMPIAHPDYGIGAHLANDVGIVRLFQPASSKALVTPIPIDFSLPAVNSTVTMVGFGRTNVGGECMGAGGTKLKGNTTITQVVVGAAPGDITLKLNTSGTNAFSCPGDSGGPAINAAGKVVGTTTSKGGDKAVFAYLEWIGMQGNSPGNRIGAWDLSGNAPVAVSDYIDTTPDPLGLLGWVDSNDIRLPGDYMALGADQVLYINRTAPGGKLRIAGYKDGKAQTESHYWESYGDSPLFNGWIDSNDAHLVGDFLHRGHDQLLLMNRGGTGGRVMIIDFASGAPSIGYFSSYTTDPWLNGWHDVGDGLLAGDFSGAGHDQVMFINRGGSGGRVLINDFSSGVPPGAWTYIESYSDGVLLNGWHDLGDLLLAGDFRALGHDQVMFVNRGLGNGRVLIADFSDGWQPAEWQYYEAYGQSTVLDTFHDSSVDVALAGDFRTTGHDQVAFVNRNSPWFGRVQVADFADGAVPASISFFQSQAMTSPLLQRIDPNDIVLAGDVRGEGHLSLFTIEGLEQ